MTIKQRATIKVGDRVLIVSKTSKYRGCEAIVARTYPFRNQVGLYPVGHEDKYRPAQYEWEYDHYLILVYDSVKKITEYEKGGHTMAKLTGYKQVAVIKQGYGTYHFAIYDDGYEYKAGDSVVVSGNNQVQTINEIITPEEAAERFSKSITAEVICPVNLSAYKDRVEKRKAADKLKKSMDKIIKEMDENSKYDMYAERNPELKEMLETYKTLVG